MLQRLFRNGSVFATSIILLLITSLIISSCETYKAEIKSPESVEGIPQPIKNITHIVMKDASYINVTGKDIYFEKLFHDTANVIIVKNFESKDKTGTYYDKIIPLDNIKELIYEHSEFDLGKTMILTGGLILSAAILFVAFILISLSNHPPHSCPYIYSFDGEKYIMDAEPLGGAVCEGLQRSDVSRLEHIAPINGKFNVLVKNVNEEKQRLDEMKFFSIRHNEDSKTAPDNNGDFYEYKSENAPSVVTNDEGNNITKFFTDKDNVRWQNDLPLNSKDKIPEGKDRLSIKFPKPKDAKNAALIINGGTSYIGSNMIYELLKIQGNKVDDWYKSISPGSEAQSELFNVMHHDGLYYMDIFVNGKNAGIMRGNGPMADEDILFPLDLSSVQGDTVEVVLTPSKYFWKFDKISISYDFKKTDESDIIPLNISNAADFSGKNMLPELSAVDKNYYNMDTRQDALNISIDVPGNFSKSKDDIYVKTTGWYDINLSKDKSPDNGMISRMFNTPGEILKYAIEIYRNEIKNLSGILNQN